MSSPAPKKTSRDKERYQATAKLPSAKLGNMGSSESVEIEVERKKEKLGTFRISRFGIDWTDPEQNKHRKSWKELSTFMARKSN